LTHPDYATLVAPLCAVRKEGKRNHYILLINVSVDAYICVSFKRGRLNGRWGLYLLSLKRGRLNGRNFSIIFCKTL